MVTFACSTSTRRPTSRLGDAPTLRFGDPRVNGLPYLRMPPLDFWRTTNDLLAGRPDGVGCTLVIGAHNTRHIAASVEVIRKTTTRIPREQGTLAPSVTWGEDDLSECAQATAMSLTERSQSPAAI